MEKYSEDFDGVLIGRAAIGNPWVLRKDGYEPSVKDKLSVALEHARFFEKDLPGKNFEIMRKHLARYAHGFPMAGEMRRDLVISNNSNEVEKIISKFFDISFI